jgi:hypothetical protein
VGADGAMLIYHFECSTADSPTIEHSCRQLPDDFAAVEWLGNESLSAGQRLEAFRDGGVEPFARREFGGEVEAFG